MVRVGSEMSTTVALDNGLPQGAMISPKSFIAMINDLPECISGTNRSQHIDTSLFADDTMMATQGSNSKLLIDRMQTAIHELEKWCDEWGFSGENSSSPL